jgi:ferredoxin
MRSEPHQVPYVRFHPERCTGCAACLKVCPTKAIRIREGSSIAFVDRCVGCGACIRACSAGAISAAVRKPEHIGEGHVAIALVSPVLYAQFPNVMPKYVLQGLRRMGFHHTIDSSIFLEMFQFAAAEFIRRNRKSLAAPWPLISPVCPAVVRLIAFRFPRLLAHVLPVLRPVALMAREVKERLLPRYAAEGRQVILYVINPCPTMGEMRTVAGDSALPLLEVSIGVNDIYPELRHRIDEVLSDVAPFSRAEFEFETCATGNASLVAMSGGEITTMRIQKSVAVSGLKESMDYLTKIELGLFRDVEYFELRTCREGCLGGVLNAADKYLAKSNVHRMIHIYGLGRRISRHAILQLYDRGRFQPEQSPMALADLFADLKPALTLDQMEQIERILKDVAGYGCGACGAPDCATFAEDVVRGIGSPEDCIWIRTKQRNTPSTRSKRKQGGGKEEGS